MKGTFFLVSKVRLVSLTFNKTDKRTSLKKQSLFKYLIKYFWRKVMVKWDIECR